MYIYNMYIYNMCIFNSQIIYIYIYILYTPFSETPTVPQNLVRTSLKPNRSTRSSWPKWM